MAAGDTACEDAWMALDTRAETLLIRTLRTPVGEMRVAVSGQGLRALTWIDEENTSPPGVAGCDLREGRSPVLDIVESQLDEYFAGRRREFDIPLDPVGTAFQLAAWKVLSTIPFGTTISYADQARALGDVRKARAVGGANGRNPIPIVVPCHRVIGADGSLTGFAAGTEIKRHLLDFERDCSLSVTS